MITLVRIAPIERWCEYMKGKVNVGVADLTKMPGMEVAIDTACRISPNCGGRMWHVQPQSMRIVAEATGGPLTHREEYETAFCEHQLEMD